MAGGITVTEDPAQQAIDFYVSKGLTLPQARGVVKRLNLESGLGPDQFNKAGGGQGAYGIAQWRGPRLRGLLARPNADTLDGQLAYSWDEMTGPEQQALAQVKKAKTSMQAYDAFTQFYERPGPTREAAGEGKGGGTAGGAGGTQGPSGGLLGDFLTMLEGSQQNQKPSAQETPNTLLDDFLNRKGEKPLPPPKVAQQPMPSQTSPSPMLNQFLAGMTLPLQGIMQAAGPALGAGKAIAGNVASGLKRIQETPAALALIPQMAAQEAQRNHGKLLAQRVGGPTEMQKGLNAALSFSGDMGAADEFAGLDLHQMLRDAIKGGRLPKGSNIEDVKNDIRELRRSSPSAGMGHNNPPEPMEPEPTAATGAGGGPGGEGVVYPSSAPTVRADPALGGGGGRGPPRPPELPGPAAAPTPPEGGGIDVSTGRDEPWRSQSSTRETAPVKALRRRAAQTEADKLFRLQTNAKADQIAAMKMLRQVPPEFRDASVQERIYSNVEEGDSMVPLTAREREFRDRVIRPMIEEGKRLLEQIRADGYPIDADGYIHRIVKGRGSMYDQMEGMRGRDVLGRRNLRTKTGSMHARSENLRGLTTREIEQSTDLRYHKNAYVNSLDNLLRLRRVKANVDYLESMKPRLREGGFGDHFPPNQRAPEGWLPVDVPQLQGWRFEPRIAHVLDDFYGKGNKNLLSVLGPINRVLTRAIVLNPLYHAWNVMNDWTVARGWDWLPGPGWHSLGVDGWRAIRDVSSMNSNYLRVLRAGAGLRYGDAATRNFTDLMIQRMGGEIERNPTVWNQIAKLSGFETAAKLSKWMLDKSNRAMWLANDAFLLQRVYELERKGLPLEQAIKAAEDHIANYRIPSEVMGSRAVSNFLQNRDIDVFSAYHYGLFKSVASMARGLGGTPKQKLDAAGHIFVQAMLIMAAYPLATMALRKITGNPNAQVRRGGVSSLIQGAIDTATSFHPPQPQPNPQMPGIMMPGAYTVPGTDLVLSDQQRGLTQELESLITPAPAAEKAVEMFFNRDMFTGQEMYDPTHPGRAAVQIGESASGGVPMIRDLQDYLSGKRSAEEVAAEELLPVRLPSGQVVTKRLRGQHYRERERNRQWKRDPVRKAFGLP